MKKFLFLVFTFLPNPLQVSQAIDQRTEFVTVNKLWGQVYVQTPGENKWSKVTPSSKVSVDAKLQVGRESVVELSDGKNLISVSGPAMIPVNQQLFRNYTEWTFGRLDFKNSFAALRPAVLSAKRTSSVEFIASKFPVEGHFYISETSAKTNLRLWSKRSNIITKRTVTSTDGPMATLTFSEPGEFALEVNAGDSENSKILQVYFIHVTEGEREILPAPLLPRAWTGYEKIAFE